MHACKARWEFASPESPRNCQHPERDQNEIGTRYKFAYFEAVEGQDRVARQFLRGFSVLECQVSRNTSKQDTLLKNKIGMNFGNKKFAAAHVLSRVPGTLFYAETKKGLEAKGLSAFQGRRGIASVVRRNTHPVIFGVDKSVRPVCVGPHTVAPIHLRSGM